MQHKARDLVLTQEWLNARRSSLAARGYSAPKWLQFAEECIAKGLKVKLYEARHTRSKYLTLSLKSYGSFKVRFSNHSAALHQQQKGDSDFYVGVNNNTVTTTRDAWIATMDHFGLSYSSARRKET